MNEFQFVVFDRTEEIVHYASDYPSNGRFTLCTDIFR